LNEAASLPELVARVGSAFGDARLRGVDTELIVVDDGSDDGTWAALEQLRSERPTPRLRAVRHPHRRGIPVAWRSGITHATGDAVCVIDGDLQYQPEDIPRLWEARVQTGADIVQGVRARDGRRLDARLLLSRGLSIVLNAAFGMSARDNKSGFFLCARSILAELLAFRGPYRHWQCFVMVAAHHHGYRIHEVETDFLPRRRGRSAFGDVPLGAAWAVARDLPTAWQEYRR
jgi:glycosyltransferase involved in cell wall biosynthesis